MDGWICFTRPTPSWSYSSSCLTGAVFLTLAVLVYIHGYYG